jgi:subtilisin family serine protease
MSPQPRPRARLSLEALEDRTVLSSGLSLGLQGPFLTSSTTLSTAAVPGDSRFPDQWGLRNTGQLGGKVGADIHATQAWDVTTGSTRTIVAIMDTGVDYTHRDLYLNIWVNQGEIPASRRANLIDINGDGRITFRDQRQAHQGARSRTSTTTATSTASARPMGKDTSDDNGYGGWADGTSQDGDRYLDDRRLELRQEQQQRGRLRPRHPRPAPVPSATTTWA